MREYKNLEKDPPEFITARPEEDNIQLWYFVIEGPPDTPYAGGIYMGKLRFPDGYPFAPPSIMMCTPTGRFKVETRLCLSMSDFHPKEWNPSWGPATIIKGLQSFMVEETSTHGSIEATPEQRKQLARDSHQFNLKHPIFCRLFPEKKELCEKRIAAMKEEAKAARLATASPTGSSPPTAGGIGALAAAAAAPSGVLKALQLVIVVLIAIAAGYVMLAQEDGSISRSRMV
jgi:ubiquitin-conjugating enzyme E2 J2